MFKVQEFIDFSVHRAIQGLAHLTLDCSLTTIGSGTLSGLCLPNDIRAFLGVPYVASLVGGFRWRPPQPVTSWTGVLSASELPTGCIQTTPPNSSIYYDPDHEVFSEDCLYLNVFTGPRRHAENRPVLAWCHWGACAERSGSNAMHMGPCRVGFLPYKELTAESEHHTSGNYGILNQIAVLKWVNGILKCLMTTGGASARGASTHILRTSPLANSLHSKSTCANRLGLELVLTDKGSVVSNTILAAGVKVGAELLDILGTNGSCQSYLRPCSSTEVNVYDSGYPIVARYSPLTAFALGRVANVLLLAGNAGNDRTALPRLAALADYHTYLNQTFGHDTAVALKLCPANHLVDQVFIYPTWKATQLQAKNLKSPWHYRNLRAPPIPADVDVLKKDLAGAFYLSGDWTGGVWSLSADLHDDLVKNWNTGGGHVGAILSRLAKTTAIWDHFYGIES
ncbi:alpha/beta-hydrolase [Xylariaceae sp. FL0255]|nr:alpha/beta-hydrolase [Xylariaceae sp. FL0255]